MNDFASLLEGVGSVAIAGHIRPDGDCVGSCLATYNYIKTWFPEITVRVILEPIPNIFKFLRGADEICSSFAEEKTYDLCIVQDCGESGRLGGAVKYFETAKKTFCVDHHISNQSFADENYLFPHASSTSELVFELIGEERVTKEIAECIYVGLIHDTGVFQYSNTSAKTMRIAGILMEKGIDFPKIVDETFFTKTFAQNKILGRALQNSALYEDGKVIATVISQKEMAENQALPKHLEGIASQLRVTKGVEAAIFLYEQEDGAWKVSMRSNGKVDVSAIAVSLGGGGHVRAAGATVTGSPQEKICSICKEIKRQLNGAQEDGR